jgi:Short-chain dehydrogenases of various substrate specificities
VARDADAAGRAAAELAAAHAVDAQPLPADLSRDGDLDRVVARIQGTPALALLVNNAGFGTAGSFVAVDPAAQERMGGSMCWPRCGSCVPRCRG